MRRHDLDPFSLAAGVLFALIGLLFLVVQGDAGGLHPARLWPVPVIALGATIVALAVRGILDRQSPEDAPGPVGDRGPE